MTSAAHVRNLFGRCIELGRRYKDNNRKEDLYESLRLMGTGLHCLEGKRGVRNLHIAHGAIH